MARLPLPKGPRAARLAAQLGPLLWPVVQRLYEQGRHRQAAILHARRVRDGRFSDEVVDGDRVWVVWVDDEPVASYPVLEEGRLARGLRHAVPDRRLDPATLPVRRAVERASRRLRPAGPSPGPSGTGSDLDATERGPLDSEDEPRDSDRPSPGGAGRDGT